MKNQIQPNVKAPKKEAAKLAEILNDTEYLPYVRMTPSAALVFLCEYTLEDNQAVSVPLTKAQMRQLKEAGIDANRNSTETEAFLEEGPIRGLFVEARHRGLETQIHEYVGREAGRGSHLLIMKPLTLRPIPRRSRAVA